MHGMHERRKVKCPFGNLGSHHVVQPARLPAAVHHAQNLPACRQARRQFRVFQRPLEPVRHPPQPLVQPLRIGGDLAYRQPQRSNSPLSDGCVAVQSTTVQP